MFRKFSRSAALLILLTLPILTASRVSFQSSVARPVVVDREGAFVHLFEWKWEDVGQECESFLGPQGYAAVQVSPATEHVVVPDHPWWQRYQPVSYKIESRSGDRSQFSAMVARCRAAGVKVYADAVINHMAGREGGIGSAGSPFSKYSYPGLYKPTDFHACRTPIKSYQDARDVRDCELVGLADLDTGSASVRRRIADYLIDLTRLGVEGFRIDAAKHMEPADIAAIVQKVKAAVPVEPYFYQEVIDPGNEAIRKNDYYANGKVIESEYGRFIGEKFLGIEGQTLSQLQTLGESWGLMPSQKAIVFIDNHDKQRGHGGGGTYLTYKNGRLYDLANIFMLAFPYGTPQVMSSYAFSDSDQGPPADAQGRTRSVHNHHDSNRASNRASNNQTACSEEWICEHRRSEIAQMVGFYNYTFSDVALTDWWSNGKNQIAFGRGDKGFVVLNREDQPLLQEFQTRLPAGLYCNVITGRPGSDDRSCTSEPITVDARGRFTATVPGLSAIAIHQGAAELSAR